jgi:error-prone DNA polymerase
MQAVGCWELPVLHASYQAGGLAAALALMEGPAQGVEQAAQGVEQAVQGAAGSRSTRPVMAHPPVVYSTGFQLSPYADIRPAGATPRKLWHASPGSSG